MKAIIAVNNKNYIGLNGGIPWKCSADMKHFKEKTNNSTLLVGHNTFSSLPILPRRTVVIDTKDENFQSIVKAMEKYTTVWNGGGKKTYEKYHPEFTELHISHINDDTIGDVMYPDMPNLREDCKIFHYYFEVDKDIK